MTEFMYSKSRLHKFSSHNWNVSLNCTAMKGGGGSSCYMRKNSFYNLCLRVIYFSIQQLCAGHIQAQTVKLGESRTVPRIYMNRTEASRAKNTSTVGVRRGHDMFQTSPTPYRMF